MSFHQSYTVGFYIIVHKAQVETETFEETRCTNSKCENHHEEMEEGVNFCPKCGSKVDWQDVTETNPYDYLEDKFREDDGYLHDWFSNVEYIDLLLGKDYKTVNLKEGQELVVCNRIFDCETEEEFRKHPATKALLERIGECDIHYGLVLYQS